MLTREERGKMMYRRLRTCKNPGYLIMRHVRKHLLDHEWSVTPSPHVTDAIFLVDLCISRINSTMRA